MVLPVPGGPARRTLCSPAAAISSARRPRSCPRTSARSGPRPSTGAASAGAAGCRSVSPRRYATASARCRIGTASMPASAASGGGRGGAENDAESPPARRPRRQRSSPSPAGRGRRAPARRSRRARPGVPEGPAGRLREARARSAGRSPCPSLRSAAGARLTVMRVSSGHASSAEITPLRTRCFASWHARSARPTTVKAGIPFGRCASTSTRLGSSPTSAKVTARPSTPRRYGRICDTCVPASCGESCPEAHRRASGARRNRLALVAEDVQRERAVVPAVVAADGPVADHLVLRRSGQA